MPSIFYDWTTFSVNLHIALKFADLQLTTILIFQLFGIKIVPVLVKKTSTTAYKLLFEIYMSSVVKLLAGQRQKLLYIKCKASFAFFDVILDKSNFLFINVCNG